MRPVVAIAVVLGLLLALGRPADAVTSRSAAVPAKIIFVNVGQGDAVVMRIGGKIIVSDTGEFRYDVLDEALRQGLKAKRIDVLILGHAHDDHAKNAAQLLSNWDVRTVVRNRSLWWEGTKRNRAVMRAIEAEPDLEETFPKIGDRFDWGGAEWVFANPPAGDFLGGSSRIAGNSSLAYLLTVNGITGLFTGDIERRVAKRVAGALDPVVDKPVDIFLATHHGSKEGSIDELLEVVRPRWAVLSAGKNSHDIRRSRRSVDSDRPALPSGVRTPTAVSRPGSPPGAS